MFYIIFDAVMGLLRLFTLFMAIVLVVHLSLRAAILFLKLVEYITRRIRGAEYEKFLMNIGISKKERKISFCFMGLHRFEGIVRGDIEGNSESKKFVFSMHESCTVCGEKRDKIYCRRAWTPKFSKTYKNSMLKTRKCDMCNQSEIVPEYPGEFRDFDADDMFGGGGLAVCSSCIGTGVVPMSSDTLISWDKMSQEVREIRNNNFKIQCAHEFNGVKTNNKKLLVLMKKAREIIGSDLPEDCYANRFIKK